MKSMFARSCLGFGHVRALRGKVLGAVLAACLLQAPVVVAQDNPDALLAQAQALYDGPETPTATLRDIRALLDRIVTEHPASDLAVGILLGDRLGALDVAAIDAQLAALPADPETAATEPPAGDPASEAASCIAAALDKDAARTMTLEATLSPEGVVAGLPKLRAPAEVTAETRAGLMAAITAIDACAPYGAPLRGRTMTAEIAPDGVVSVSLPSAVTGLAPLPGTVAGQVAPAKPVTLAPLPGANADQTAAADPPSNPTAPAGLAPLPGTTGQTAAAPVGLAPLPTGTTPPPAATEETDTALELDRQAIRDLQARLQVIGHDPNGIDGVTGKGTRSAVAAWQAAQGFEANGFLNAPQLAALKTQSQQALEAWLTNPDNARLHTPPPPIAIGPRNMAGQWRFTTNCGSRSRIGRRKITGGMAIAHAGGNAYAGRVRNSQGLRGTVSARVRGRTVTGTVNWGLLFGKVNIRGRVADQKMVITGTDSNRCSFYASKSR